jgi:hypothetical protein
MWNMNKMIEDILPYCNSLEKDKRIYWGDEDHNHPSRNITIMKYAKYSQMHQQYKFVRIVEEIATNWIKHLDSK